MKKFGVLVSVTLLMSACGGKSKTPLEDSSGHPYVNKMSVNNPYGSKQLSKDRKSVSNISSKITSEPATKHLIQSTMVASLTADEEQLREQEDYVTPWHTGIVGCDGIKISAQGTISSYDSDEGTTAKSGGNIQTISNEADITISGQGTVLGHISAQGADSDLNISGQATVGSSLAPSYVSLTGKLNGSDQAEVTGELKEAQAVTESESNCDPLGLESLFALVKPTEDPTEDQEVGLISDETLKAGVHSFQNFTISGQATLSLAADGDNKEFIIYVSEDFTMSGQSELKVPAGIKVSLYVAGQIKIADQTSLTVFGNPDDFLMISNYEGGGGVSLSGQSETRAVVYAPKTDVYLAGQSDFKGAVRGRTIELTGQSDFYFDHALSGVVKEDEVTTLNK